MKSRLSLSFVFLSLLALGGMQIPLAHPSVASEKAKSEGEKGEKGKKKEGKEEEDITGGRFEGDPIYVHVKPLILPIINDQGVEQIVSLIVDIHVKDSGTADTLHKNMPRVVDALLRHLYGGLEDGTLNKGKLVNLTKIKAKAVDAISEIVDRQSVVDVLIEGVSQRML